MTNNTNDICKNTQALSDEVLRLALTQVGARALAAELEKREGYRVLRELEPLPLHRCGPHDGLRCAIIVDTETTGLIMPGAELSGGPIQHSEIVSIALVSVAYDPADGHIKGSIGRFHAYREPSHPIPPAATAIHGITDDTVRGRSIDEKDLADFIALSAASVQDGVIFGSRDEARLPLIIAHNAGFDRQMMEHRSSLICPGRARNLRFHGAIMDMRAQDLFT